MSDKVVLRGYEDWFGKQKQELTQYQKEDLSREAPIDVRKLEHASRLADRIVDVTLPLVQEVATKKGDSEFRTIIEVCTETANQLSNSALVDKILEADSADADEEWSKKPLRLFVLAMLLRDRF